MERFVTTVNGQKLLTIMTKRSMLDVAASPDQALVANMYFLAGRKHTRSEPSWCLPAQCEK